MSDIEILKLPARQRSERGFPSLLHRFQSCLAREEADRLASGSLRRRRMLRPAASTISATYRR